MISNLGFMQGRLIKDENGIILILISINVSSSKNASIYTDS